MNMALRSALFNALFWIWIAVLGLCALPISCVYQPFTYRVARTWARGTLWLLRVLCGITYEVRGREYIPHGTCIVASKHQSAWDTVIFWLVLDDPAYVLKRELIFFPVFGWYLLLLKSIYIDRKSGSAALKRMLRESKDRVAAGRPIVIFPEGTRTAPGASTTYHPGVAALYNSLGLPVVPVALNSGLYWPKNAFVKTPGKIIVEFLPAIAPGLKGRDFLAKLQETVEGASRALLP
jgi:1-acyl-sn-glycerol-3-phosphate acyltransferase